MPRGGVRSNTAKFIEKAQTVHGDRYGYERTEYVSAKENVIIVCHTHGEFRQTPSNHTHKTHARGCPKCGGQQLSGDERFWSCIDKNGSWMPHMKTQCWNWTGSGHRLGYGMFMTGRKVFQAHRYSWELHNGEIPENLHCLHRCDNPSCCRPDHLFLGTHADNMQDKVSKGRSHRMIGEDHPNAKLTWRKVREIRRLRSEGKRRNELAKMFSVSESGIDAVLAGRIWKDPNYRPR